MKAQIRNTLITVCTAGTIATTIAPLTTPSPEEWVEPLRKAGIVLAAVGMATILTDAE
ncbi:hypothetical protein QT972_09820 [Microcoleus sp. herbarium7]|uniref:hypothetical protein n=1 Tax=Microcoleus sp. herbarium7 TaxID=3055435 RepID=UPI002FD1D530